MDGFCRQAMKKAATPTRSVYLYEFTRIGFSPEKTQEDDNMVAFSWRFCVDALR